MPQVGGKCRSRDQPPGRGRRRAGARACPDGPAPVPRSPCRDVGVLDPRTFERLTAGAAVVTAAEQRAAAEARAADRERLKDESRARTERLRKYDAHASKGPRLGKLDSEAQKKTSYLLNRAFELQQNQEEEIKKCDSLILSTKCHVIRCAQIAEKELIQKEKKEEERRLERLVEQERILTAKKYQQAVDAEKLKKKLQAMDIVKQMKENEIHREWEAAKEAEDARIRKEAAIEAQRSEIKDYHETLKKQAEMRKEFLQVNAQLRDMKSIEKELAKIEILQIQAFDRKKNEREAAFEEEMRKQKNIKEKEIAKIRANQKAAQDLQAAKDELNAIRTMDKVEREWRRKEQEEALRKIKDDQDLKEARLKQIEDQRIDNVEKIQKEQDEFNRIIKLTTEDLEKVKEEDRQTKMKIDKHRKNLLEQITEKEMEKIHERKMFFLEGVKYKEAEIARKKALHETMKKKMETLKAHNFPTNYIEGIERQLKL